MGKFRFYHPIEIRYGDLDPQGHVNNARYLTYFEQGRIAYIAHLGLWDQRGSFMDIGIILADAHITFLAPLHFGQKVQVGVSVTRLGNKSLSMEYTLRGVAENQEYANGSSVLVSYEYHTGRTIAIPDHWRETITAFENLQQDSTSPAAASLT